MGVTSELCSPFCSLDGAPLNTDGLGYLACRFTMLVRCLTLEGKRVSTAKPNVYIYKKLLRDKLILNRTSGLDLMFPQF